MANITLTNLPTVTGLNGTEPLLGVQNSSSVQITTGQIAGLSKGSSTLPFPVSIGGTGDTTLTQYGLMYGNGTAPVGVVSPPSGTNYVLVGSSGSAPTWQPTIPVTAGVDSISFGTTGLTPSTAQAGVITVAGTLVAANGGTGQPSYVIGDLLYASGTTALSRLADVATGNALLSGGVGAAPSWGQVSLTTTVTGTLPITNGGTGQASALTQYGLVYGASATAMGVTAAGTTGQVLIATTSGAPTWGSVPSTAAVTSITFGTTGLTPSTATTGAVTVAGTLVAANGGTGQSSYAVGDLLYASTTTALSRLADVATGSILVSGGVNTAPVWSASPTITTSITTPLVIGGTAASSTLTLESTSGAGTTDSIIFKTGSQSTRMTIDTSGYVGIGTATTTGINLSTNANITGATSSYAHQNSGTVQSGVTTLASAYHSNIALAAASFTTTSVTHFQANPAAGGAGSTITNQYGFLANSTIGTQGAATINNAYGFYGAIAAATNNYNLYMGGTANNYMAGNLGIGNTGSLSANNLVVGANITGSTGSNAIFLNGVVQSGVTSSAFGVQSNISLAAASFTTTLLTHFYANPATGGAGSTITTQIGFNAESTIGTGGAATITNAYGFYGAIASGTNKWNLYMAGTASNYMAGALGVGTVSVGAAGTITASSTISDSIGNVRTIVQNSQTTAYTLVATDNGKFISITTGGVTVPASIFTAGQNIVIYNNSSSTQTITQGASVTMTLAGSTTTGARSLAANGVATVLCTGTNTFVITGQGLT